MANAAPRIAAAGISGPLAVEIAAQYAANAGNANNLIALGVPPVQAQALAASITGSNMTSQGLANSGWTPGQARILHSVRAAP